MGSASRSGHRKLLLQNDMRKGGLEPPPRKGLDPKSGQRASCLQVYGEDKDSEGDARVAKTRESATTPATSAIRLALLPLTLSSHEVWA